MTTHAHQVIGKRLRTIVNSICGVCRRTKCGDKKKAKATLRKPNHRTIVFFEMP